jgi:hypothetical protein
MNERIKQLAEQAGIVKPEVFYQHIDALQLEKFAELIVAECVKVAMKAVSDDEPKEAWYLIKEHFGVEE